MKHRVGANAQAVVIAAVFLWGTAGAWGFEPLIGDYSRDDPLDVRVMSYNHNRNFIEDPGTDVEFGRILTAIDPDIICFQEFTDDTSAGAIASRLNLLLPISSGGWEIHLGLLGGVRTVLASRFPLGLQRVDTLPASSTRGVNIALADLPDGQYATDLYLMGVHLKCCGDPGGSEDASRQDSADAIANWLGDARGVARPSGNQVVLAADTPIVVLGDFNLVGGPQPEDTILTGDIQDPGTYGPDVAGDWDNSNMVDLMPADPFTGDTFTWQGNGSFPPSALDRIFLTDSVVTVANSFVFNTDTMTSAARAAIGVQAGDTLPWNTSDHLPIVVDLRLGAPECFTDPDCDDGDACNGLENCLAGACQPGIPVVCADGNPCTDDACDMLTGDCVFIDNNATCNDGDPCTANDACMAGVCAGAPIDCDDGLFCNGAEICGSGVGCQSGPAPCVSGTWCDEDGAACVPLGNGDFDLNGRVDLLDLARFQTCLGGVGMGACAPANAVGTDGTIDLADWAAVVGLLTGP
jgi:endonuclease/exonuclease/phosphatase family metal-dependent hydrolase